ncbi:hypothetical protein GIB67_015139 [Kingdonia uniflora]|uniref:Formin-like protein n=1 Tax=Kingdonia uniflora TaxID=39325 RepID=A0A7J7LJ46_9MAGN|nr:hypothetical protein GIB67_015139 [Kingdonia uniflora]
MKMMMGCRSQITHLVLFIFFLNAKLLVVSSSLNLQVTVEKVSGKDETEEKRGLVLEKFRFLLGLSSFDTRQKIKHGHGVLPPSPSPSIEAPAPIPLAHAHLHSHRAASRKSPPHNVRREHEDNGSKVKTILMAVLVSSAAALVVSTILIFLLCRKCRRRRSRRTMSVSSSNGGFRKWKYASSPVTKSKVSLDLGPEHFYQNSLGPISEPQAYLQNNSEIVITFSKQDKTTSTLDKMSHLARESIESVPDDGSISLAEEIILVDEELSKNNFDASNCSPLPNQVVHAKCLSSDDESFYSFCDSNSSNFRISNASEGDLTDACSLLGNSKRHSSPDRCFSSPKPSSSVKLPTPSEAKFRAPALHSDIQLSSRNSLNTRKQATLASASSLNYEKSFPPPPPTPSHTLFPPSQSLYSPNLTSLQGAARAANIPPPPCPPLLPFLPPAFIKSQSNNLHPLPPPLPQITPVGKDGAPLPKLKPLHWDKVRSAPDHSMVWDKLRSNSFELDEKMIESLFGYNLQGKNDDAKSKSPSPSKHVLEPKRLQNITILSKALNATPDQVCDTLVQGKGLCLQQLEALVRMVPTAEEAAKLTNYQGDINDLGSAEKIVKAMLNVPFAFGRIEAMLFRDTFEDEVLHLQKSFTMLEEACRELRSSRLFLKLLEAVLKTGNRMNVGTIRGGARAFKLDALLKLADVKGTDGKTTLLHFVVQEMIRSEATRESGIIIEKMDHKLKNRTVEEMEEEYRRVGLDRVSGLCGELCNVKKTATVDLDVLVSSVSNLLDGMIKLQSLMLKDLSMDNRQGCFIHSMKSFLVHAETVIKDLKKDEDRVLLNVKEVTEYFHGVVSKDEANPLRIFVIVRDFLGLLDQVCKELRSLKTPNMGNSISAFR